MSKFANAARIILLVIALVGVIRLMRYLETDGVKNSSFFHILLGEPQMPKPLTNKELPAPLSEVLTQETKNHPESNESQ